MLDELLEKLKEIANDPIIVESVEKQNSQDLSIAEIQKRDQQWIDANGSIIPKMTLLMENKAAGRLYKAEESKVNLFEFILMDNQGANVAITNQTSDYWQGDEDKFQKVFPNGPSATHISKPSFDKSVGNETVQISVPVVKDGGNIGVLCVGVILN